MLKEINVNDWWLGENWKKNVHQSLNESLVTMTFSSNPLMVLLPVLLLHVYFNSFCCFHSSDLKTLF